MERSRLKVKVFSPYQTFFKGSAISLSALNATGPFDVLPGHARFFSLLETGFVQVNTGFETVEIAIEGGILRVHDDEVTLFANVDQSFATTFS